MVVSDLSEQSRFMNLRDKLQGESGEKVALQRALTKAYVAFVNNHPDLAASFFDSAFLSLDAVVLELSKILTPHQTPSPKKLQTLWKEQFSQEPSVIIEDATGYFLSQFENYAKSEPDLKRVFDSRALENLYQVNQLASNQTELLQDIKKLLERPLAKESDANVIDYSVYLARMMKVVQRLTDFENWSFGIAGFDLRTHVMPRNLYLRDRESSDEFGNNSCDLNFLDIVRDKQHFVLCGEGGMGKSTLVRWYVNALAQEALEFSKYEDSRIYRIQSL